MTFPDLLYFDALEAGGGLITLCGGSRDFETRKPVNLKDSRRSRGTRKVMIRLVGG